MEQQLSIPSNSKMLRLETILLASAVLATQILCMKEQADNFRQRERESGIRLRTVCPRLRFGQL